jgi:hypothetical protein
VQAHNPDVIVENHGSLFLFHLLTEAAESFLDHVDSEAQTFGNALVVEPRYAADIAAVMRDDFGLVVR